MIQKHVRVDMPVIESFGTAGGVRRGALAVDRRDRHMRGRLGARAGAL